MSTLTKICIVLVFVLSLLGSAVFIQKAATDANWKEHATRQRARANLSETDARNQMLAAQNWRRLYEAERDKVVNLDQNHRNLIATKNMEISRLAAVNGELQGQVRELNARFENLDATLKVQIDLAKNLSQKLEGMRKNKIELEDKLRNAQDQLKENLTQIESLTKEMRVQKEEISGLEQRHAQVAERNRRLVQQLVARGVPIGEIEGVAERPAAPKEKIEGTVIAVKEQLASLNIGSKDKVKKDMVFILYRGAEFVGHLRIADVGTDNCAGIMYDTIRDVRVGDKATTKLE